MITRRDVLTWALGATCAGAVGAEQNTPAHLRLVTTVLPPFVMEPGGAQPGALREIVEALCHRLDKAPDVSLVPWRRALYLATTTPRTAIFPLTRLAEREAQFRWLAPLYEESYIFLAPKRSGFDMQRPKEMTGKRIALLRGAAQSAILREMGFHHLVEGSSIDEIHRFLLAGMADAAFGERAIIHRSLAARGQEQDFIVSQPVRSTTAWLAGSLDFTEDEAVGYRTAMTKLVTDGTQRKIFKRYGLDIKGRS